MFYKSILTTAALASILALGTAGAAHADPTFSFGMNLGGPGYYGPQPMPPPPFGRHPNSMISGGVIIGGATPVFPGPDFGYGDDVDRYHYRHRYGYRVSCGTGANIARSNGFHAVRAYDCSAPVYGYRGWKYGQPYDIQVSIRGRIVGISPD